jgi:hypothetical protein
MRWTGHVAHREKRNRSMALLEEPERRPLGRPKHRRKDNIQMEVKEIGHSVLDWIHLAQDRDQSRTLVNRVMTLLIHTMLGNSLVAERLTVSQEGLSSMESGSCGKAESPLRCLQQPDIISVPSKLNYHHFLQENYGKVS